MPMKIVLIPIVILCIVNVACRAQVYSNDYELFTTRDGLPHNNILSALQDSYGFLWVGTYNGLAVYDGNRFNSYKAFELQEDNWIYAIETIYEDENSDIWIGTRGGLVSTFRRKEQKFTEYKAKPIQAKVKCICKTKTGPVWIGFEGGLLGFIEGDSIRTSKVLEGAVLAIRAINSDSLFILSEYGQYVYGVKSGKIHSHNNDPNSIIIDIDKSKTNTVVLATNGTKLKSKSAAG